MTAAGLNLISSLITLVSFAAFAIVAFYVFRLSLPPKYPTDVPWKISGGMIIIALILFIRLVMIIYSLYVMDVWGPDFWGSLGSRFEESQVWVLKVVIVLEIVLNTFLITATGFMILLFFKTRDIFPTVFMIVLISQEIFVLADEAGVSLLFGQLNAQSITAMMPKCIGRWLVVGLMIWYVRGSNRSVHTFVLPHSSLIHEDDADFLLDLEEESKKGAF